MPTAVSVVADLADVACSRIEGHRGLATRAIQFGPRKLQASTELRYRYYLRFDVENSPGVLAEIAGALGSCGVSIEELVQEGATQSATLLMTTHTCKEGALLAAIQKLEGSKHLRGEPRFIRIEDI
jgi:homoserine dehydrogenase